MALRKITGKPGSGKTFMVVRHLAKTYFKYDKLNKVYEKAEKYKDVTIITNIEELKLPHISLNECIKAAGSVERLFTQEYQEKIHNKYPQIVYVIDECQQYFHRKFYDVKVFYYFEYHRHFGDDIYLVTQHQSKICKDIGIMAEYEQRAIPRTMSLAGEFKYKMITSGETIDTKVIRKDKKIFELYKSSSGPETEKIKKPYLKYILIPLLLLPIAFYMMSVVMKPKGSLYVGSKRGELPAAANNPSVTQSLRPQPIRKQEYKLIKLNGWVEVGGQIRAVVHPLTKELMPIKLFEYKLTMLPGRYLYARIPLDLYLQIMDLNFDMQNNYGTVKTSLGDVQ